MIYPQKMFSANGQITMKSKVDGEAVNPGPKIKALEKIQLAIHCLLIFLLKQLFLREFYK